MALSNISENLRKVKEQIRSACLEAGRNENEVKLLAVSKFHPAECVQEAVKNGHFLFGENRVQESCAKFPDLKEKNPGIVLHIIGQLQTNKVKKAVEIADCIESVDRISLLQEIEKQCAKINKNIKVYLEVHTGEESKSGFADFEALEEAVKYCADGNVPHVVLSGLMTMAPLTEDEQMIRKSFRTLKEYFTQLKTKYTQLPLTELSMGMSNDYRIAIQEGSTEVRVGTAIFGQREY